MTHALLDDVVQPDERAAADEQDIGGVDLQELLLRMLAPAFRGHVADRSLQNLQQGLLDAFTGHIARDRGVLSLAGDFVDLVDVYDPALRLLDVVIGVLQQVDDDVLDVLANVPGLGQVGRVRDGERNIQNLRQRLGQQGLAATGGTEEQDIRLAELDVLRAHLGVDPLVVVVDRHRQDLLGAFLPDHIVIENGLDIGGLGNWSQAEVLGLLFDLLRDDVVAQADALIADVHRGPGDQLLDLPLALSAERAGEIPVIVPFAVGRHYNKCSMRPDRVSTRKRR